MHDGYSLNTDGHWEPELPGLRGARQRYADRDEALRPRRRLRRPEGPGHRRAPQRTARPTPKPGRTSSIRSSPNQVHPGSSIECVSVGLNVPGPEIQVTRPTEPASTAALAHLATCRFSGDVGDVASRCGEEGWTAACRAGSDDLPRPTARCPADRHDGHRWAWPLAWSPLPSATST